MHVKVSYKTRVPTQGNSGARNSRAKTRVPANGNSGARTRVPETRVPGRFVVQNTSRDT